MKSYANENPTTSLKATDTGSYKDSKEQNVSMKTVSSVSYSRFVYGKGENSYGDWAFGYNL